MKKPVKSVLTLRNLPEPVSRAVRRRAADRKTSLNKAVISLLEEAAGGDTQGVHLYHDLDALAGKWSVKEAQAFEADLAEQRSLDEEAWR